MDINDFLSPVELDPPPSHYDPDESAFSHTIETHTPDHPITNFENVDLAIIGIPEDRNSHNIGAAKAPDKIREKLYQLKGFDKKLNIIDLGNLKPGKKVSDTYVGANEVFTILNEKKITTLILGGTQDVTISACMAAKSRRSHFKLLTVDRKLDFKEHENKVTSDNYLHPIFHGDKNISPAEFVCAGYQTYFVNDSSLDFFRNKNFILNRLGLVRANLPLLEPQIRDSNVISIDISSVKQSDAPGFFNPSPNGFYGEEICQVARYAGLGEKIFSFGVFEVNPEFDSNHQTTHLAAQICWYFIDGLSQRANENPEMDENGFKKFIVAVSKLEQQIVFYKSMKTNRWWMRVPSDPSKFNHKNIIVACSSMDYDIACQDEIPDKWIEIFHRYN